VNAIRIVHGNKSAYFKETVPIANNYDLKTTLEQLCIKAKLSKNSYLDKNTKIYKYDTITFIGDQSGNIVDLYRYNILVSLKEINNDRLIYSISLNQRWFLHDINRTTNMLEYEYAPSKDRYSSQNSHVRQLASLWAMTELSDFLHDTSLNSSITQTLNYYLSYKNTTGNYTKIDIDGSAKLAYNAFLILALENTPKYPKRDLLLTQLANGILHLQYEDGSYDTIFNSTVRSSVNYFPGEAMLALITLYNQTKEDKYLNSVAKAFPYYRTYWRNNKNAAMIPWHTQTYFLLYQVTKNPELIEFIFEMTDWLIDYDQIQKSKYPDKIGGFPKSVPSSSAAAFLEGITDAYSLAVLLNDTIHIEKYKQSIKIGIRFVLQTQFTEQNSFYLKNSTRAIGGFKKSLVSNNERVDYTQQAVRALIKTYESGIFT
jgi:hypothetical protein